MTLMNDKNLPLSGFVNNFILVHMAEELAPRYRTFTDWSKA